MAAGYSGTPLARKLGIKEGARVAFLQAPDGFDETVAPLPRGVRVERAAEAGLDVVVFFTRRAPSLRGASASSRARSLRPAGCGSRGRSARRAWRPT